MPGIQWKKACNPSGSSTSQASGAKRIQNLSGSLDSLPYACLFSAVEKTIAELCSRKKILYIRGTSFQKRWYMRSILNKTYCDHQKKNKKKEVAF